MFTQHCVFMWKGVDQVKRVDGGFRVGACSVELFDIAHASIQRQPMRRRTFEFLHG